jgi:uncharacterized membrane protein YraQ (UPF0718 family)
MRVLRFVKNNKFLAAIVLAYAAVLIFNPAKAVDSVDNSWYYVKEMLQIMPVVFLLTALMDAWIPKEVIMRYLGSDSKMKGVFLSFILGSISAGPIYSAFPICVVLLKKGATVRNIVIILSAWAVIKVPMLIAEVKFLGIEFMIVRWILTVIAILIFSYFTEKIVGREAIPSPLAETSEHQVVVNESCCMGCSVCTKKYPELFEMIEKKAHLRELKIINMQKAREAASACPVNAIEVREEVQVLEY